MPPSQPRLITGHHFKDFGHYNPVIFHGVTTSMQRSFLDLGQTIKFFKVGEKVRGVCQIRGSVNVFECEMSVAYEYFKVLSNREYYRRTSNLLPRSDNGQLIRGSPSWERDDMKKLGSDKKDAAPVAPARAGNTKAPAADPSEQKADDQDKEAQHPHRRRFNVPNLKKLKTSWKGYCAVLSYAILGAATIVVSIAVIIVTSLASVATKIYDAEQSSRLVAMIVLAVTAAITLSMVIYAVVGAFRKHTKPVYAAGIVLVILGIIQALIAGVAVNVTERDELTIGKSLSESFQIAKENNQRHVKVWAATQADLQCCGVYGPEDYRDPNMPFYFPPNIPISCCPTYDSSKPPYNQERQRELCKVNNTYFDNGCKGFVIEVFKETAVAVIAVIVALIVCEVLLAILGSYVNKKNKAPEAPAPIAIPIHS